MTFVGRADARFLQSFRDGERSAFEIVYRAYADPVARAIAGALRRYGREGWHGSWRDIATDVPDLVQEVFARAFEPQTRRSFDGAREYGPFLRQIARNVVVDHLRRRQRQMTRDTEALVDEISVDGRPHELPADPAIMAIVGDYVARLSPEMQRIHEAMYVRRIVAARSGRGAGARPPGGAHDGVPTPTGAPGGPGSGRTTGTPPRTSPACPPSAPGSSGNDRWYPFGLTRR